MTTVTKPTEFADWCAKNPPPNLQDLINLYGGDYWAIPEDAWREYVAAMKAWEGKRKDRFLRF